MQLTAKSVGSCGVSADWTGLGVPHMCASVLVFWDGFRLEVLLHTCAGRADVLHPLGVV